MGNRGQVLIRDNGIYLYTHCGKNEMLEQVKSVLADNEKRWGNPDKMTCLISKEIECDEIGNTFIYCYQLIILDFKYKRVNIIEYPTASVELRRETDISFVEFIENST